MINNDKTQVVFDRITGALMVPDQKSLIHSKLIQGSHKLLSLFGYFGVSRIHALINKVINPKTTTVVHEKAFRFSFPSTDYYWNRLLDEAWTYEPEIATLLSRVKVVPFVFVDLGANFGYWSARLGSGRYGDHPVIAVEASAYCFSILVANTNRLNISTHNKAIDQVSNQKVALYGQRHAGFSIDNTWYGASKEKAGEVVTITIDDLLRLEGVNPEEKPVLIKLDVEGVEKRALLGARNTIEGMAAFIIEDASKQGVSDAVQLAMTELSMSVFSLQADRIIEALTLDDLLRIKVSAKSLQATGLNLIATKSDFWREKLRSAPHEKRS